LEASKNGLIVEAHGDSGDLKIENKTSKELEVSGKDSKSIYPSDYLDKMCRAASESEPLTITFGSNKPIKISYKLLDAQLVYFLAPRVESA